MSGHVHPKAKAENDIGPIDASETLPPITLIFRQTPQQQADLDRLLTAQQDPSSPDYHRWLSPEQYADRFGASPDDIAKITAWLEQHNLHVTTVGRGRTSIAFSGDAGDVEQTLQVSFHRYAVDGRNHFANTGEPSLPVAIQAAIGSIHGLNDFRMQPRALFHRALDPNYTSSTSGNHYLSPDDLGTIYNIKGLWNAGYDGSRTEDRDCGPNAGGPRRHTAIPREISTSRLRSADDSGTQYQRSGNGEGRPRRGRSRS